jgi:hypothetical protein
VAVAVTAVLAVGDSLERVVKGSNKFLGRRDMDQIYQVPIIRGEQVAMGDLAADRDMEDKHSRRRSTPLALRLLTRPSPDRGSVRIISIQYFIKRGSHSSLEKGEREIKRESVVGGGAQSQEQMYNIFACGRSSPEYVILDDF